MNEPRHAEKLPPAEDITGYVTFNGKNYLFTADSVFVVRKTTWWERLREWWAAQWQGARIR